MNSLDEVRDGKLYVHLANNLFTIFNSNIHCNITAWAPTTSWWLKSRWAIRKEENICIMVVEANVNKK